MMTLERTKGWLKILLFYNPNYRLNESNAVINLAQTQDRKSSIAAIKSINLRTNVSIVNTDHSIELWCLPVQRAFSAT